MLLGLPGLCLLDQTSRPPKSSVAAATRSPSIRGDSDLGLGQYAEAPPQGFTDLVYCIVTRKGPRQRRAALYCRTSIRPVIPLSSWSRMWQW